MDLLLDAVCVVDRQGQFLSVSAAGEQIFGYTPEEMTGLMVANLVHPDDRDRTMQAVNEIIDGELKPHFENRYVRKDGSVAHIMWSARWSEAEQVRVAVARDVTLLKRAESLQAAVYAISEAANLAEDLPALFQRIHEVIEGLLPAKNLFVALYDAAQDKLEFPYYVDQFDEAPTAPVPASSTLSAMVIRTGQPLLLTPDTAESLLESLSMAGKRPLDWLGVPLESTNGVMGALVVQSYCGDVRYTGQDMELLHFVSTQAAAAVERKQTQIRLQYMAQHDQLTDLPNRALFQDRLRNALARARREKARLAVLFLDLDKFKAVNDCYGHLVGDELLQEVALRLKQCVRESDTVGRLGGDEFVVLINGVEHWNAAAVVAEKIRLALCRPCELQGRAIQITPSIGIAVYPEDGEDDQALLCSADGAMYLAKTRGGNHYSVQSVGGLRPVR